MTAQTAAAARQRRSGDVLSAPVKASAQIWQGGLVALLAGQAIAARVAANAAELATLKVVGVASSDVLGGAADGDVRVPVERAEAYRFANSAAGDAITAADIDQPCFLVDDQTVAKTIGNGRRPIAGTIADVDSGGVWVRPGSGHAVRRVIVPLIVDDLRGAQAKVYRIAAPRGGAVTRIFSTLDAALTTGDAILTGKIGATAITGAVVTIPQATAVAGTVNVAEATALNTVAEGDVISVTVSGPNTGQVATRVLVEITF